MQRLQTTLAIALAAFGIAAAPAAAAVWREPDRTINSFPGVASADAGAGSDLADVGGSPVLTWSEWSGSSWQIRGARLEGSQWTRFRVDIGVHDARSPHVAGDGATPWVTWLEKDGGGTTAVRVGRPEGNGWADVGEPVDLYPNRPHDNRFYAGGSDLAFVGGKPYLGVMEDNGVDFTFALLTLNSGGHWVRADTGKHPYFLTPRSIELETIGERLYLNAGTLTGGAALWRLAANGHDWEEIPVPADADGGLAQLADIGGSLHALYGATEPSLTHVARFDGSAWQQVGPALPAGSRGVSLTDVGGVPNVLLTTAGGTQLGVARLNGGAWQQVAGGSINNVSNPAPAQPLITAVGGVPYVSWAEYDGCTYQHRVARPEDLAGDDPPVVGAGCTVDDRPHGGGDPPPSGPCATQALGTDRADRIFGDAAGNTIRGLVGNDRLYGLAGDDCLFGGVGNDLVSGGDGDDVLHGDAGHDRLKGGAGADVLGGGSGNDRLTGGPGNDTVSGGSGNDVIDSRGSGHDTIDCGSGRDVAIVGDLDRTRNCERVLNRD